MPEVSERSRRGRVAAALVARPFLAAGLVFAALALLMVSPALVPGRTLSTMDQLRLMEPWKSADPPPFDRAALPAAENSDTALQLQPMLRHSIERLPEAPLWNPHIMNGRPLLANAQSAPFSAFNLPAYALSDLDAHAWIAALKWWAAALGMFGLGRALGMRMPGALLAGLVYGFSFWMVAHVTWPHASVWAWIPWMLLAAERLLRRPDLVSGAALALVTGAQFLGGHPESSFHAVGVTVLFFALRAAQARHEGGLARRTAAFCAALATGGLLAACMILPFTELLFNSSDLADREGTAIDAHLPTKFLLAAFLPDYWGRATATLTEPFQLVRTFYAGGLALMLAVAALVLRPRTERVAIAAFGAVSLAVVVGVPPFLPLVTRLPVLSSGHNRFAVLWLLSLALLAGWGLDEVAARAGTPKRRRRVELAVGALFAVPIAWVLLSDLPSGLDGVVGIATGLDKPPDPLSDTPGADDAIRFASLLVWLVLGGAALALLVLRLRGRIGPSAFVLVALGLAAADLLKAGMGHNPAIERADAKLPDSEAIRVLEREPSSRFASMTLEIPENVLSLRHGLLEARGYDLPLIKRYDRLWRSQVEPECPSQVEGVLGPYCIRLALISATPRALHTLRTLAVQRLLQPSTQPPLESPELSTVYEGRDGRIYRIRDALPRAWIATAQRVVADEKEALAAVADPEFDARRAVVSEEPLEGVPAGTGNPEAAGEARIVRDEPEHVTIEADATAPGVLVLADTWFPGWTATVDGRDAEIAKVDYVHRGVPLTAGRHVVDFRYRPLSWTIGWITSLLTLLGLAAALVVGGRRRRSARSAGTPSRA
jgi:hypothetical protein